VPPQPLGVLRRLPCSLQAVLLPLFLARVASEQARRLEHRAKLGVGGDQGTGDPVAHGAGLAGDAATEDLDRDLETARGVGDPEGLGDHGLEVAPPEVLARWAVVDNDDAITGDDADASDRRLATAGGLLVCLNCCGQR
jgi:hypothetical protein